MATETTKETEQYYTYVKLYYTDATTGEQSAVIVRQPSREDPPIERHLLWDCSGHTPMTTETAFKTAQARLDFGVYQMWRPETLKEP